jgi:hypothetical protein
MAADLTQTFQGKHFEKLVLLAAAALFVVAAVLFVGMRENQVRERAKVEETVQRIKEGRKAPTLDKALTPEERTRLGIDQPPATVADFANKLNGLPEKWDATKDLVEGKKEPIIEVKVIPPPQIPKIVPVTDVRVVAGRGTTSEDVRNSVFKYVEGKTPLCDIVYVACVGQMNLTEQQANYIAAKDLLDPDGILVTQVELQRRELKNDGTWSDWQAVTVAVPKTVEAKLPKKPTNPRDRAQDKLWHDGLKAAQADIRRMPLYRMVASDEKGKMAEDLAGGPVPGVEQPEPPRPEPVALPKESAPPAEGTSPAAPAPAPAPSAADEQPFWATTTPGTSAKTTTTAPVEVFAPKQISATLWAYDTSVEPGRTYEYRMRSTVFNPILGHPRVKDEADRWKLELAGDWSQPSAKVTVPKMSDFFFIGMFGERANLHLRRWLLGQWYAVPSMPFNMGAPVVLTKATKVKIPGGPESPIQVDYSPNTILVDVIRGFMYQPEGNNRPTKTNLLIYADSAGRLDYRIDWEDKNRAAAASAGAGGPTPPVKGTTPPPTKGPTKGPEKTPTKRPATK